eukprot:TRINITY_DN705_c0_g1_i2.p2 TRINITY_DN705_c0_g1~~TRINITY_DN705_c0_g1_i2.p2  ORF type:complete len:111 (-),score=38.91 TRINITY_DN705_c0_g1_i2:115-447(-)
MSNQLIEEIQKGAKLKHAETVDKSAPLIDSSVQIKEAPQVKVFEEIKSEHHLKPTETKDKSAPLIDKDVKIKPAPQIAMFEDIKKEHKLKHVEETNDRSAPAVSVDASKS